MNKDPLAGLLVYGFGDSIVYGHTHPEYCFLRQLSAKHGFRLVNLAVNGATVMRSDNHILAEVENAPDAIVFTCPPIATSVRAVQPLNIESLIVVIPSPTVTLARLVQL